MDDLESSILLAVADVACFSFFNMILRLETSVTTSDLVPPLLISLKDVLITIAVDGSPSSDPGA